MPAYRWRTNRYSSRKKVKAKMEYQKLKTNLSVKEVWWAWTENRCCLITFGKQSMLVAIYHPRQSDSLWITVLIHFYLVSILDKNYNCWWVTIIFLTNKVAFSVSILLKDVDMTDFLKNRNNTIIWLKEHSHHNGSLNRVWFMLPLTCCTTTAYLQHSKSTGTENMRPQTVQNPDWF